MEAAKACSDPSYEVLHQNMIINLPSTGLMENMARLDTKINKTCSINRGSDFIIDIRIECLSLKA